jgi:CheY-like chemotaxis protein
MEIIHNKILFVDDDPDDLEFYGESMKVVDPGLQVAEARSGMKALEYLEQMKQQNALPSLIILDINMPVMSGKETLVHIRQDEELSSIPVVIFSTASNPNEKHFFEGHEVEFFTKPCTLAEMQQVAKKLLSYCV